MIQIIYNQRLNLDACMMTQNDQARIKVPNSSLFYIVEDIKH